MSYNPLTLSPSMLAQHQGAQQHQPRETARSQRRPSSDANIFPSGAILRIPRPTLTPAAILGGHREVPERIELFPRKQAYTALPCLTVTFAVHGEPAPYLRDIIKGWAVLDAAEEEVMRDQGWSRTRWELDWPGYNLPRRALDVPGLTRLRLAQAIASAVMELLTRPPGHCVLGPDSPWAVHNVQLGDVRLVAVNYYPPVWVPVLAFDA